MTTITQRELTIVIIAFSICGMDRRTAERYATNVEQYFKKLGIEPLSDDEAIKSLALEVFR